MKGVDEVMKAIADEPTTQLEASLIRLTAPKSKAAVGGITRIAYPTMALIEWLYEGRNIRINPRYLHIDASVALTITIAGESRALAYISKTMAVDILWLNGNQILKCLRNTNSTPFASSR